MAKYIKNLMPKEKMKFSSVADIVSDIADGKPVIVIDSEDRENEGDLVIASELATPETINFMAKEGRV